MANKEAGIIVSQKEICPGIFDLWIKAPYITGESMPGQFVNVYLNDSSKLLPRPISICEANREEGLLRLVYRVSGQRTGTEEMSRMKKGEQLSLFGPHGNGFPLEEAADGRVFLIGGGIGIPPMLETARQLWNLRLFCEPVQIILGYRDQNCFLADAFRPYGNVVIATEDGSVGAHGTVLDAIREKNLSADVIFACGPRPMLSAIKNYSAETKTECWISMEERMACGIGACLACVCRTTGVDRHSNVHNRRVCKDGPVFRADEILLD